MSTEDTGLKLQYKIVYGDNLAHLEHEVKGAIENGWRPQGGMALERAPLGTYYYQAMVKT